jgi:hypothetical protein
MAVDEREIEIARYLQGAIVQEAKARQRLATAGTRDDELVERAREYLEAARRRNALQREAYLRLGVPKTRWEDAMDEVLAGE